jgi:phosphoribosylamine--glycine ligase
VKALVIGSGAGEHALAWKLSQSPAVSALFSAPGNYGTNMLGSNVHIPVTDVAGITGWAKDNAIDLTVVGSDVALAYGVVEAFREHDLRIIGPTQAAARLETSPTWAAAFIERHEIPAIPRRVFEDMAGATAYLAMRDERSGPPILTLEGPFATRLSMLATSEDAVHAFLRDAPLPIRRGPALRAVLEEAVPGPLVAFSVLTDGSTVLPLTPVRLHQRAFEGDNGPLSEGMGAWAPVPEADATVTLDVTERILKRALDGLAADGHPFQGILSAYVVLTPSGPLLSSFKVRLAEPEALAMLPRWQDDLFVVLLTAADKELHELAPLKWSSDATCAVVIASEGYPGVFETGYGVIGLGDIRSGDLIFHNGTRDPYLHPSSLVTPKIERTSRSMLRSSAGFSSWLIPSRGRSKKLDQEASRTSRDPYSQIVTADGRVVTVVGRGRSLADARAAAYRAVDLVAFTGAWCRRDIGLSVQDGSRT